MSLHAAHEGCMTGSLAITIFDFIKDFSAQAVAQNSFDSPVAAWVITAQYLL